MAKIKKRPSVKKQLAIRASKGEFQKMYDGKPIWVSQNTIDETIFFGNPHHEEPKYTRRPDNLGSIEEFRRMFPETIKSPDPSLLLEILEHLGYHDFAAAWEDFKGTEDEKEALDLMNSIVSKSLWNRKYVKPNYERGDDLENNLLAAM